MKKTTPSSRDLDALLHRHLIVPASIWTALLLLACVGTLWERAEEAARLPISAPPATASAPATAG